MLCSIFVLRFVLRLADVTEGIIVSNDNYYDLWHEMPQWRKIIQERFVKFIRLVIFIDYCMGFL